MEKASIVFSGASSKIPLHVGFLKEVVVRGIEPIRIAGTSSGAIIAAMFAAGYMPGEMEKIILDLDFAKIVGFSYFNMFNIFYNGYVSDGSDLHSYIAFRIGNVKFDELGIPLDIIAFDVNTGKMVVFNKENTPKEEVARAVCASSALPFVFRPVEISGKLCYDGGLAKHFPVDLPWLPGPIIGHLIGSMPVMDQDFGPRDVFEFMVSSAFNGGIASSLSDLDSSGKRYCIVNSDYQLSMFDFSVSRRQKIEMISIGYSNAHSEIERFLSMDQ